MGLRKITQFCIQYVHRIFNPMHYTGHEVFFFSLNKNSHQPLATTLWIYTYTYTHIHICICTHIYVIYIYPTTHECHPLKTRVCHGACVTGKRQVRSHERLLSLGPWCNFCRLFASQSSFSGPLRKRPAKSWLVIGDFFNLYNKTKFLETSEV